MAEVIPGRKRKVALACALVAATAIYGEWLLAWSDGPPMAVALASVVASAQGANAAEALHRRSRTVVIACAALTLGAMSAHVFGMKWTSEFVLLAAPAVAALLALAGFARDAMDAGAAANIALMTMSVLAGAAAIIHAFSRT